MANYHLDAHKYMATRVLLLNNVIKFKLPRQTRKYSIQKQKHYRSNFEGTRKSRAHYEDT